MFGNSFTSEIKEEICSFVKTGQLNQHERVKVRQQGKFERLTNSNSGRADKDLNWRQRNSEDTNQSFDYDERWVKNISSYTLTDSDKSVLSRGLNFAITPNKVPIVDIITETESGIHRAKLPRVEAESLRNKVAASITSTKLPKSNISKEEWNSLRSLSKNDDILILPADKGRCTVVLDRSQYDEKARDLLSDKNTYELLKRDPTSGYKKQVVAVLQKLQDSGAIDRKQYLKLYPTGEAPPAFYGLPKIHKIAIPLRPIISSIGSVTYNIARFLADLIGPLAGKTRHNIKNSADFVQKVKDILVLDDETITSYDVVSLFTCIPIKEAIAVVREYLLRDNTLADRTKLSVDQICELLELCLSTTYFVYNGQFYKQLHGCAMGSPVSPIVVNLYMEQFEQKAIESYPGTPPLNWFRYVDDTWNRIKKAESQKFFDHINQIDDNIRFTEEGLDEGKLAFLDTQVHLKPDGSLDLTVYRKKTHTDQYLLFDSHHPLEHKLGVVRTLCNRANSVVTSETEKDKEYSHIKKALGKCGYQEWTFNKANRPSQKDRTGVRNTSNEPPRTKACITLPFIDGLSQKLRRVFKEFRIQVGFKPYKILRRVLVHPKDPVPKGKKCDLIYKVECQEPECQASYIGETSQPLKDRFAQHRRASTNSAVFDHQQTTGHTFKLDDVQILDKEPRWFERGVREAIFERKEAPKLNKKGGLRHELSYSWNKCFK